jgi:voltage-gated potassium channel
MNTQWLYKKRFEILLLSFLLLMFGNTFFPVPIVLRILVTQNMLTGILVFYRLKLLRKILIGILVIHTIWLLLQNPYPWLQQSPLKPEIYLLYFVLISYQVYKHIFKSDTVSAEMISAVMCGFILLCFIATFLFAKVEGMHPNSFSNIGTGPEQLDNLNYLSVTTLLTISFSDIVPLTLIAKRAVMLMALASHFYTVFVTAIVIGKYLRHSKPSG